MTGHKKAQLKLLHLLYAYAIYGMLLLKSRFATVKWYFVTKIVLTPSIRDRVLCSGMLLYLHHRNSKIFFHPAKFDNFKNEKISDFKTVSVSQIKGLLD